jgi:hypothetical protein
MVNLVTSKVVKNCRKLLGNGQTLVKSLIKIGWSIFVENGKKRNWLKFVRSWQNFGTDGQK